MLHLCPHRNCPDRIRITATGVNVNHELCNQCHKIFKVKVSTPKKETKKSPYLFWGVGVFVLISLLAAFMLLPAPNVPANNLEEPKSLTLDQVKALVTGNFDCYTCQSEACKSQSIRIDTVDDKFKVHWQMPTKGSKGSDLKGRLFVENSTIFLDLETQLLNKENDVNRFEVVQVDQRILMVHQGLSDCTFKKR